jgi:chemotaxis response regulator CheB
VPDSKNGSTQPAEQNNGKPVIVAIGASAGGIHASQSFFDALPEHTGAAFVVVVHLDPQHRSEMPSIIAARTKMPVVQVGTRDRLQGDHVYVIPPDRRLQLVDHEISALEFDEPRGRRSPIDLLIAPHRSNFLANLPIEDYFFPYTALGSNTRSPRNSSFTAPPFCPSGTAR